MAFFFFCFHQWSVLSVVTIGKNESIFGVVASDTDLVLRQCGAFWETDDLWDRNCLLVVVMSLVQGLPLFCPTQKHNYNFNPLQ